MKTLDVFGSEHNIDFYGDLLPCPMCGSEELWIGVIECPMDEVGVIVECQGCGIRTKTVDKGSYHEDALIAINLWNRRTKNE